MIFAPFEHPQQLILIVGSALLVGFIAGIYPALFLTSVGVTEAFKSCGTHSGKGFNLRKLLFVFQFTVSIILLIATLTIMKQRKFIQTKDLGFDKEQIVWFDLSKSMEGKKEILRDMLMTNPAIIDVAYTRFNEADANNGWSGEYEGREIEIHPFWVDAHYINLMRLKIVDGRNFSNDFIVDPNQSIILNQTAIREFGINSPIGKKLFDRTVIGVVEDFNFQSLRRKIEPLGLIYLPGVNKANIKISTKNVSAVLSYIEETWKTLSPDYPFEYHFWDESYGKLYESEKKVGILFNFFSLVALLIASVGLYGLASFSTEQRTKEIGVRKVLGASVPGIVTLLSKDFLKWVLLANFIAWPIAYYAMNKWLQNYAYRINMGCWMFVSAAGITLVMALFTVSWQAIRAATANPVESLRYE
jgi:putative ABC transport system permease protein